MDKELLHDIKNKLFVAKLSNQSCLDILSKEDFDKCFLESSLEKTADSIESVIGYIQKASPDLCETFEQNGRGLGY